MATEIGGLKIIFGDPRQPKALPLSHPKARWDSKEFGTASIILKKGSVRRRGCLPLPCDILFERDQPMHLRDGTRIFVDIFRPVNDAVAVPALVAWSPYGKQPGKGNQVLDDFPFRMGVPLSKLSEWQKWEGPDPAYWVNHGYAIINPDPRGAGKSEGDIYNFGTQEGRDGADVIDWVGAKSWCNGKVSMSGNSYLSITQWFIAAEKPKHLAAIAPWEGFADAYRESGSRGSVPSKAALTFLLQILQVNAGENSWENTMAMGTQHPLHGEYHLDKAAKVDQIQVPAYVTASWSNPIHVYGTFRSYLRLKSPKWLRVHDSIEWPDYYDETNRTDLHRFYDRYLKGIDNGWESTPRFRGKIIDTASPWPCTGTLLTSSSFPPAETRPVKVFLDAERKTLSRTYPLQSTISYKAAKEELTFEYTFDQDTTLCGPLQVQLAVSLAKAEDSDVFIDVEKVLATGYTGSQLIVPFQVAPQSYAVRTVARLGLVKEASFLLYKGPRGQRRLSRRLNARDQEHVPGFPIAENSEEHFLRQGQIELVELCTTPIGMFFRRGEKLRARINGVDKGAFPPVDQATLTVEEEPGMYVAGEGVVTIHCGLPDSNKSSHLVLPVIGP